uniref:Uncharacterized protein n=1 Tax=Arundo donax TaxID=35708 RepID=A0A0A8Y7F7_ARUDO
MNLIARVNYQLRLSETLVDASTNIEFVAGIQSGDLHPLSRILRYIALDQFGLSERLVGASTSTEFIAGT